VALTLKLLLFVEVVAHKETMLLEIFALRVNNCVFVEIVAYVTTLAVVPLWVTNASAL